MSSIVDCQCFCLLCRAPFGSGVFTPDAPAEIHWRGLAAMDCSIFCLEDRGSLTGGEGHFEYMQCVALSELLWKAVEISVKNMNKGVK